MEDHLLFHMVFNLPPPSCTVFYLMTVITFRRENQRHYSQCQHGCFFVFPPFFHFLSHNYLLLPHIIVFFSPVLISQPVCPMQLAIWKQQVSLEYTYTLLQFTIQQFCFLHIFSLYRIIPPVLPHMQQIKILFTNCYIQHKLMYSLMMNQKGPTHVGVQCF